MTREVPYKYTTLAGEMLDEIMARHPNCETNIAVVLSANPGVAKLGPVLPAGIVLTLPVRPVKDKGVITLWGAA